MPWVSPPTGCSPQMRSLSPNRVRQISQALNGTSAKAIMVASER